VGLCTFLTWLLLKLSPRFKNGFVFLFVKAARALGFDFVIDGLEPNGICDEPAQFYPELGFVLCCAC
jgi:hypothetical protein